MDDIARAIIHETGHALAAVTLSLRFEVVTVDGACGRPGCTGGLAHLCGLTGGSPTAVATVIWAGPLTDDRPDWRRAAINQPDLDRLDRIGPIHGGPARRQAAQILTEWAPDLEDLAGWLADEGTIDYRTWAAELT